MTGPQATPGGGFELPGVRAVLWTAARWLALVALIDLGTGVLLGSGMWWLGWKHPPIKDFFVTLAGIGGALLIAYSVTFSQVAPIFVREKMRTRAAALGASRTLGRVFGAALGVALAAVLGLAACLALVRDPVKHAQWVLMSLFGVSVFTLGVLAVAIGLGTVLYVFLFLEG